MSITHSRVAKCTPGRQLLTKSVNKKDVRRQTRTWDKDGYNLLLKQLMFILTLVSIYNINITSLPSVNSRQALWNRVRSAAQGKLPSCTSFIAISVES